MSQNASRSTKGGGPPPPASGKVFQKQGVDGSNAKFSQNNNTFSNKSTKLLNNTTTNTTTNNTNGSLDENHNQQQHTDKNGTVAQPLKPTAEQVRLASLINGKSDDPEINKKIKQVLEVVSDKNQDEALMALHESDYDVSKAINLLFEGTTPLLQDWTTVGLKKKQSSNQAGDETAEGGNHGVSSSTTSFGKNKNNSNNNNSNNSGGVSNGNSFSNKNQRSKDRDRTRGGGGGGPTRPSRKFNDSNNNNNNNLDERFENLDIKDGDSKAYNNNFSNSDTYGENGNNSNENDYNNATGRSNSNKRSNNFRNNNGVGGGGGGGRGGRGGGSGGRNINNNNRNNNNGFRNGGGGFQRGPRNENYNNRNKDFNNAANLSDENNLTNENELVSNNENLNEKNNNVNTNTLVAGEEVANETVTDLAVNAASGAAMHRNVNDDNLRDIGTWSNDHAASKRKSAGSNVSNPSGNNHQRQSAPASGNRFNSNNKNVGNAQTSLKSGVEGGALNPEDWENEEEWQGDLTKTQIFTASTQKKETVPEAKSFDSNFPIGHFNAEEATQNIKKAVGIGASTNTSMTNSSMTVNKNSMQENKEVKLNQQQQQQQQQQKKLVIGSVKPPPPSTKIPKSAVIMPDVGSNSSTSFSLDVQFGVDLDQPVSNIVQPPNSSSSSMQQQNAPSHSYTNSNLHNDKAKSLNINAIGPVKNAAHQQQSNMSSSGVNAMVPPGVKVLNTDSAIIKSAPISTQPPPTSATVMPVDRSLAANQVKPNNNNNNLEQNLISKPNTNQINSMPSSSSQTQLLHTQTGAQQNNANFDNIHKKLNQDSQYNSNNSDNKNQPKSNFNSQNQQQQQPNLSKQQVQQAPIKQHHSQQQQQHQQQQQQQYINHLSQSETTNMLHQQQQQSQPQLHHQQQQQHYQHQSSSTNSQLLNVSPQNAAINNSNNPKTSNVQNTQQSAAINQLQQQLGQSNNNNNTSLNNQVNSASLGQNNQLNATAAAVATAAALANANNKPGGGSGSGANSGVMQPPPGVTNPMVNPSNQFLMSLPFQQNGLYFDPSQMDTSLMQMYNHLASVPPPGVNTGTSGAGTAPGPQYPISDSKFTRNDSSKNQNSLNSTLSAAQLSQQQQQQQQPVNLIPNFSNFPFILQHYYPNMFMSMPNGPQTNPQQFQQQQQPQQNKLPYNFNSNTSVGGGVYDDQSKDYNNYNPQNQIKPSNGSNLNNVSDLSGYQKNVEKSNAGGYHTPPPNFSTSLLNQQPHPNSANAQGQPQYTYIASMIGASGQNMVHPGIQDTRNVGSNNNNMKSLPKSNQFPNSSWN